MAIKTGKTEAEKAKSPIERRKASAAIIKGARHEATGFDSITKRLKALEDMLFENSGLLDE